MSNKDIKLAKTLFNYQRIRILQVVKNKEKTVKEIAEELNEKPSRLYYHINQLEELGLLSVVNEKQVGNLIQKYYKSVGTEMFPNEITFENKDAHENAEYIFSQLYAFVDEAISKIYVDLNKDDMKEVTSEVSVINVSLTKSEWKVVNQKIREIISERNSEEEDINKKDVRYIVMSYLDEK